MTIAQAVSQLDALTPNPFSREEKLLWLSRAEAMVAAQILQTPPPEPFDREDVLLLAPAPFDELYLRYMQAQIALEQGEIGRCNNAMALFNTAFSGFLRQHIRENPSHYPNFTNF